MLDRLSSTIVADQTTPTQNDARIFADGEMADRIRGFAWEKTPLGPLSGWPESLLGTVNLMLESQFPMLLAWGPEMIQMYNDACIPLNGEKHPRALGQAASECWSEAWEIIGPQFEAVLERGERLSFENRLVPILRNGKLQDIYWTYSYSPVRDRAGGVCGLLVVSHDVTAKLTAERERDASAADLKRSLESTTAALALLDEANEENKRLLTALKEERDWLMALISGINDEVWFCDAQGSFTWANPVALREFGVETASGIEVQRLIERLEVLRPDGSARPVEEAPPLRALRGELIQGMEEMVRTPAAGELRHRQISSAPVRDASGQIIGAVSVVRDISERKRSEEALRAAQSRFRKLFESDLMGVAIPDRFGAFRESNDELLRMTGYTRADQDAGLVRWDTMTPPEYAALDAAHIREAAERGSCTPYEKEYVRKDGTRVPILCGYALLEGSNDEYIGFILDLSERKRAERELRERELRFRILAESLPQLIWMTDARGLGEYCNRRFYDYLGVCEGEMAHFEWRQEIHPEDRARTLAIWDEAVRGGEPYQVEYRLRGRDGTYRYFLTRAVPLKAADGTIERWIGSLTDVHDQKLAEDALRKSEKLATAGRLAASIAHEINNPLAGVTNSLYLALLDDSLSEQTKSYLRMAEQELRRVAHITTQTLRFHKQSNSPARVDVCEIVDSVLTLFGQRLASKNIRVRTECERGSTANCFGDEVRQVIANLVSNSLDAMPAGGALRVRVKRTKSWAEEREDGVTIVVADTGHGIPGAVLEHIFEPFVSTKEATGIGLGLWVSEGIVRKHGGAIRVRSRAGAGTVFRLFLPCGSVVG